MAGMPIGVLQNCCHRFRGEVFSETLDQFGLRSHEHDGASRRARNMVMPTMWRVGTVVSQRLPWTRWFELRRCDKSGTFFPDTHLKERHCNS